MNRDSILDLTAVAATVGIITDVITVWAGLWTIIWLSIRIYESDTVQIKLYGKPLRKRHENEDD